MVFNATIGIMTLFFITLFQLVSYLGVLFMIFWFVWAILLYVFKPIFKFIRYPSVNFLD